MTVAMTFIKLGIRLSAVLYIHRSIVFLSLEVNTTNDEDAERMTKAEQRTQGKEDGMVSMLVWFEEEMKQEASSRSRSYDFLTD